MAILIPDPLSSQALHAPAEPVGGKRAIRQNNEAVILHAAERVFAGAGFGGATMAAMAEAAGLPKANLHYYFGNKRDLYRAVLANILQDWLVPAEMIHPEAEPASALTGYIHAKMQLSWERPSASRVFANELLHGAQELQELLHTDLRSMVLEKAAVIDGWIAAGRMAPVDSLHLFFTIWSTTQTYADFDPQICAVLGVPALDPQQRERATRHVTQMILRGCGLSA